MITLKFKNWDKYNKRQKDIKRPYWFAMSNQIFLDPDYLELSLEERQAFLFLLCEASRQNKFGETNVSEKLFQQITGLKKSIILSTISKLDGKCLILLDAAGSRQDGGRIATATEQNKTEQDITNTIDGAVADAPESESKVSVPKGELERIYRLYPRKEGKAAGMESLLVQKPDLAEFERAVRNYSELCKREGTEPRYVKHFSTFVGSKNKPTWRDYLEIEDSIGSKSITLEGDALDAYMTRHGGQSES